MVRHGLPISTKKCHSPDLSANVKGHLCSYRLAICNPHSECSFCTTRAALRNPNSGVPMEGVWSSTMLGGDALELIKKAVTSSRVSKLGSAHVLNVNQWALKLVSTSETHNKNKRLW